MVDLAITTSEVQEGALAQKTTEIGGVTITAGQVIVKDATTGQMRLAKADDLATAPVGIVGGIALHGSLDEQPVTFQTGGTFVIGSSASVAPGVIYVLSGTAGGIAPAADLAMDDKVVILGVGDASDGIKMSLFNSGITFA